MDNNLCVTIFTPYDVWKLLMECQDIEGFRTTISPKFKQDFDIIITMIQEEFDTAIETIESVHNTYKDKNDHDVGKDLSRPFANIAPWIKKFVFLCRKNGFLKEVYKPGKARNKLFKEIEPKKKDWKKYPVSIDIKHLWSIIE